MLRQRWTIVAFVCCLSLVAGCESQPETISCTEPTQTKTWLLSNVDPLTFETHPNGSFQFPFLNGTRQPVSLKVRSIGCSCYQLRRQGIRLKIGDPVEIPAGHTEILGLYVTAPVADQSNDYRFSMEYESQPGQPTQVIECRGTMVGIPDIRLAPSLLSAEFTSEQKTQSLRFEFVRSAEKQEVVDEPIVMEGWPGVATASPPTPVEPATQLTSGIWQRRWRVKVNVASPEVGASLQEFSRIRMLGGSLSPPALQTISAPWNTLQLMIRQRSGIAGPKLVHLGEVRLGDTVQRRIQLASRDKLPFLVLGPSNTELELSLRPAAETPSNSHWVELIYKPQAVGPFLQKLEVLTDHPGNPRMEIDIRANVLSQE